jgi:D-glycero-beta-D-manno-heptose-7-phosphate kinase
MQEKLNLHNLLKEFKKKRVLIVGDVMVDEYLWGSVNRISPEAPVPVVSCTEREYRMGGAANVAINVKSLGAEPIMCTVIGNDSAGEIFNSLLHGKQMTDAGIIKSDSRMTTMKTRIIGNHQHLLRVDHEMTAFLDKSAERSLLERISEQISQTQIDAVIFQDYDKGVLTNGLIEGVTLMANGKAIPTLVDPKKRSFLQYRDITLFKPNFKEFTEGLNLSLNKTEYSVLFEVAKKLLQTHAIKSIMITLSEKGVFVSDGENYEVFPAQERDIADVSGAGDTVIGITALAVSCGLTSYQSAVLANLAGGLVCEKVGVVPITPEMLLSEGHTTLQE